MLRFFPDHESLSRAAADHVVAACRACVTAGRRRFDLALSGGSTPKRAYGLLAERLLRESDLRGAIHFYWCDERCVPPDDPASNYAMAKSALLDPAQIPAEQVHRIRAEEADAQAAALRYDREFPANADLLLLGMGADGHTASLFPHSPAAAERVRRFAAVEAQVVPRRRITITPAGIASARNVLVLLSGRSKSAALQRVFAAEGDSGETPARLVRDALWFVADLQCPD